MKDSLAADRMWEQSFYQSGKFARCPYDYVASFVFRNAPPKVRNEVRILEVGCGTGNNSWFLSQEGFACYGTDGAPSAINYAKARCGPACDLRLAEFPHIPFPEEHFDLAFDRAAICYTSFEIARVTIENVRRALRTGGRFLFTPYSFHSAAGMTGLAYTEEMIREILSRWRIIEIQKATFEDFQRNEVLWSEWRVSAEKIVRAQAGLLTGGLIAE
jgi:SAM-dependent methyltransferase